VMAKTTWCVSAAWCSNSLTSLIRSDIDAILYRPVNYASD
jgi:hypothetical protein